MDNSLDKVKACQIPEALLKSMPTEVLLSTCLKYPLLHDYLYANSPHQGLQATITMFNGLSEFTARNDAAKVWLEKYMQAQPDEVNKYADLADKGRFMADFTVLELLIANDKLLSKLTPDEKNTCLKQLILNNDVKHQNVKSYGSFGDAVTAFVGRKIIKTIGEDPPAPTAPDPATAERIQLKETFEKTMLPVSPETISEALNQVKEYVKTLK